MGATVTTLPLSSKGPLCESKWCYSNATRIELRRHTLGQYWERYCDGHTSEDEYGHSTLVAVELLEAKPAPQFYSTYSAELYYAQEAGCTQSCSSSASSASASHSESSPAS